MFAQHSSETWHLHTYMEYNDLPCPHPPPAATGQFGLCAMHHWEIQENAGDHNFEQSKEPRWGWCRCKSILCVFSPASNTRRSKVTPVTQSHESSDEQEMPGRDICRSARIAKNTRRASAYWRGGDGWVGTAAGRMAGEPLSTKVTSPPSVQSDGRFCRPRFCSASGPSSNHTPQRLPHLEHSLQATLRFSHERPFLGWPPCRCRLCLKAGPVRPSKSQQVRGHFTPPPMSALRYWCWRATRRSLAPLERHHRITSR